MMSSKKFPLYNRPCSIAFLDDEGAFLETLGITLPRHWSISLFTHPSIFINHLKSAQSAWMIDVENHHGMLRGWWEGNSLPKQIVDYWRGNTTRYALPNISVVDYSMPSKNGLDVLRATPAWPACRILLTGVADEKAAVAAFNEDLIEHFIRKQDPSLFENTISAIEKCIQTPFDFHEGIWRSALNPDQVISTSGNNQQLLWRLVEEAKLIEYVVLAQPFGILGLTAAGSLQWIQLELSKDAAAMAEIASAAGFGSDVCAGVAKRSIATTAEFSSLLDLNTRQKTAPLTQLNEQGLKAAHFDYSELGTIGLSHDQFIAQLPTRAVIDFSHSAPSGEPAMLDPRH